MISCQLMSRYDHIGLRRLDRPLRSQAHAASEHVLLHCAQPDKQMNTTSLSQRRLRYCPASAAPTQRAKRHHQHSHRLLRPPTRRRRAVLALQQTRRRLRRWAARRPPGGTAAARLRCRRAQDRLRQRKQGVTGAVPLAAGSQLYQQMQHHWLRRASRPRWAARLQWNAVRWSLPSSKVRQHSCRPYWRRAHTCCSERRLDAQLLLHVGRQLWLQDGTEAASKSGVVDSATAQGLPM